MIETHLEPSLLEGYRDLTVTAATAASAECHLMVCEDCRLRLATLASAVDPGADPSRPDADRMWEQVLERVDRPRTTVLERTMRRFGVREATARLLAVTPALRLAWLAGVAVVAAMAALAAEAEGADPTLMLALAPLVPVLGVATAFGPVADPAHELGLATPTSGFRLMMLRTVAVLATTLPVLFLIGVVAGGGDVEPAAWLLPCLTLVSVTLAIATWTTIERAASVAGLCWVATLTILQVRGAAGSALAEALLSGPIGQPLTLALGVGAALVVVSRHQRFNEIATRGGPR